MKRILFILMTVLYLLCISGVAVAATGSIANNTSEMNIPKNFTAVGIPYKDNIAPFHRFQNIIEFHFVDGKEVHAKYSITYKKNENGYGPAKHVLDLFLTYDMNALKNNEANCISGTFTYYHDFDGTIKEYEGKVTGRYISTVTQSDLNYDSGKNAIMLSLVVNERVWSWDIYLETTDGSWISNGKQEGSPQLPTSSQTDVAVSVGISTLGIVLLNIFTKTSISGAVSFNLPSSALQGSLPSHTAASSSVSAESAGAAVSSIKKFLTNILLDLRDMLTDEGRSYISGKTAEKIKKTEISKDE